VRLRVVMLAFRARSASTARVLLRNGTRSVASLSDIKVDYLVHRRAYIDGSWVDSSTGETFPVLDPATGQELCRVPDLCTQDVSSAIDAAHEATAFMRGTTAEQRAHWLHAMHEAMLEHQDDLGLLLSLECGKPLAEAKGEVAYGASFLAWFAEEGKRAYGTVIPHQHPSKRLLTIKQAVGPCALITPWNFPNAMIARKVAPALAAGCASVIKPAEDTPLSALAIAAIAEHAGVPRGAVNVVTCSRERAPVVGKLLAESPLIRKLSFTGSTAVGKLLAAQCTSTVKRVSLELGGNAPFIVFNDADLDAAVSGAVACKFRNAGQTCVCANRLFVHEAVYDEFVQRFTAAVNSLKQGPPQEPGVNVGPVINERAVDKVARHVSDAVAHGASIQTGGKLAKELGNNFYLPTVLRDVTPSMEVFQEETFGPVAPIIKFKTEDEVVAMANDTNAGLAAYFYSRDVGRCWRVAERLEYGMVGINQGIISTAVAPFGGVKESGIGREGGDSLSEFMETKYMCMGL